MYKYCPFCGAKLTDVRKKGFQCRQCLKREYFNPRPTATVVPIYKDQILVGARASEPSKGKLDLIGGFVEYGEGPKDCAVREFKEEQDLRKLAEIKAN